MAEEEKLPFTVFVAEEKAAIVTLVRAVRRSTGPFTLVLYPTSVADIEDHELASAFAEARALNRDRRLVLATKDVRAQKSAAAKGWETVTSVRALKSLLAGHASSGEALRAFSPETWRRDIRSRLQFVGLLALPRMRIWALLVLSGIAFLYVFFRLLPSAQILVWPNQETGDFTTNVYFAASGAVLPVPKDRVRFLPLERLTVHVDRTITYDQISKNFTGGNARVTVTVFNDSGEPYSLRKGTRMLNQAGMRFRLQDDLILPSKSKHDVIAIADPLDQYGEVLGSRGNVPAGLKWDFPGLAEKERSLVYARNEKPGTGGTTSYVSILTKEDIEGTKDHGGGAKQRLEQELLLVARQQVEEERINRNNLNGTHLVELRYDDLTKTVYSNFDLSESFVGKQVSSVPVKGSVDYTVILYDENELLNLLVQEVRLRIPHDKTIVESTLSKDNMDIHVIAPWDDDLMWVKITADLTYNLRYVLSPITPTGAKFGKYIRDNTAGKSVAEAYRIIKNLPEVSRADIKMWPPWTDTLPEIGASIAITEQEQ